MFFSAKLLFYCTQLRFVQLSNKAYDDDTTLPSAQLIYVIADNDERTNSHR